MELVRSLAGMLAVAILMCSGNLCITASKQGDKIPYIITTVTLLIEILKLTFMLTTIAITETPPPARFISIEAFYYAIPSFLYTIDNNLNYIILRYMDAATLSMLWNLKIVVTAVLFRIILKQTLSDLRMAAILLLVVGVLMSQSNHVRQMQEAMITKDGSGSEMDMQSMTADKSAKDLGIGVVLVLLGIILSSCASVFTEWTFKRKSSCPFLWQNLQMYAFGVFFNATGVVLIDRNEVLLNGFFHGYNNWTLTVVVINSIGGIGMGLILKYIDNIACVFSHSMAMMLTMLFSMLFFSFQPSLEFGCGFTVLIISMYIYHHPQAHIDTIHSTNATKTSAIWTAKEETSNQNEMVSSSDEKPTSQPRERRSDEDTETDTISIALSSDASLSSRQPTSMRGLQLKKSQYAMLPSDSDDLESARANAKAMDTS
ncbi:hypothetical protein CCR75_001121 [Bremia lactucae]|uniref:Uncharacterized protein n=1 Tax=Bremia lactucae TaxID=4779 RepID=A0A976ILV9_BRELC|nr:hypothetical protein CCR75_001121 [Bremia lactucae]